MNFLKIEQSSENSFNLHYIFENDPTATKKIDWVGNGFDSVKPQEFFKTNPDTKQILCFIAIENDITVNGKLSEWQSRAAHRAYNATLTIIDEPTMLSDKQAFIDALPAIT